MSEVFLVTERGLVKQGVAKGEDDIYSPLYDKKYRYRKLVPLKGKVKIKTGVKIPAFERFSIEPTYMHFSLKKVAPLVSRDYFSLLSNNKIKDLLKKRNLDWGVHAKLYKKFNCYIDAANLEVVTGIHDDMDSFQRKYKPVQDYLDKNGFVPSSLVEPEMEGGCHMNFDLSEIKNYGHRFVSKFIENYRALMFFNPDVVWAFLPPGDNVSSIVSWYHDFQLYNKGDFFTLRDVAGCSVNTWFELAYIEIRHFSMPKSDEELRMHYEFCRCVLRHVYFMTCRGEEPRITDFLIRTGNMKYSGSKRRLKSFCLLIGFDFSLFEKFGKLEMLEKRFEYGSDYLI